MDTPRKLLLLLVWVVGVSSGAVKQGDCEPAGPCSADICKLPNCFCSGNETKTTGAEGAKKPQIVYLTFDDALTDLATREYYNELFGTPTDHKHSNPNGCALRATHFITHSYTDYSLVNYWWHAGHEMASHSITHRTNQTYWQTMTEQDWINEIVGMRRIAGQFAAIDPCELDGMRSPFLQGGGDSMYTMLQNHKFKYDCTWPTRSYGYVDAMEGLYPYTLDYRSVQDCPIQPCPKCAHPGLWVQPMTDLEDEWIINGVGQPCSMLDACNIIAHDSYANQDPQQVYDMLMKNFKRVYEGDVNDFDELIPGNRAPWGLYMHAAWFFGQDWHFQGYKMFIEEISDNEKYPDVWIVPIRAGIDYMQHVDAEGRTLSNEDLIALGKSNESPFGCQDIEEKTGKYDEMKNRCGTPQSCRFPDVNHPEDNIVHQERYMKICSHKADGHKQNCPDENSYPWLETETTNPCGGNVPCADCPA